VPVQEPEAVHDVALVEDQLKVTDPLVGALATELVSIAVGAGAAGVDALLPPPQPGSEQAMTKASASPRKSQVTAAAPWRVGIVNHGPKAADSILAWGVTGLDGWCTFRNFAASM
jgi:hypothetical protein